jgi:protein-L-isoaspartate(D-aspartate) O-methyltransferase
VTEWRSLAADLAAKLAEEGALTPDWRMAFEQVPRHVFLPGHPLEVAYANDAVTVQQRPAEVLGGNRIDLPTSSASQPAVVAVMLNRLDTRAGMRVLEIGAGTGWNAALLCHRLGEHNVVSIDLEPGLVDAARTALASLGYRPTLVAGDGYEGVPQHGPYDAILATCSISHIPPAWIGQLRGSGRIVAPLHGSGYGLMILRKTADDEVTGWFDPTRAAFMPLRTDPDNPLETPRILSPAAQAMPHYGTTNLDPAGLVDVSHDFALFLHLHIPGLNLGPGDNPPLGKSVTVSDPDSMAAAGLTAAQEGAWPVIQRGQRRLWDTIEHATRLWDTLGRPGRDRYGITALDRADRQYVWLDDQDGPYSWPMPL